MGFGRRVVRKTVRKATPRPVRQVMHPARTVKNAATPRPVKQIRRAAYTVRKPVGAAENAAIGAVLNAGHGRRKRRKSGDGGLFRRWFGEGGKSAATPPAAAKQPDWRQSSVPPRSVPPRTAQRQADPSPVAVQLARWRKGPGGTAYRAIGADLSAIQAAIKPAADQSGPALWDAAARLAADVTTAMAAPPMPGAQLQHWWAIALADFGKAARDLQADAKTGDGAMLDRGILHFKAAVAALDELIRHGQP